MTADAGDLLRHIRDVPDFPSPGIVFKDITPLLNNSDALAGCTSLLAAQARDFGATRIAGVESRGFIFGSLVAQQLGVGFVPVRKPGKLPCDTVGVDYELEYGTDRVEVHLDAFGPDDVVVVIDDVLATGGTAAATAGLVERTGARLGGLAFLLEIGPLGGRERLAAYQTSALITC